MMILLGFLLAHAVLAQAPVSPWWVPDLTLVGMVLAIGRHPERWAVWAVMAAGWAMVWAIRMPWLVGLSYLGSGWGVRGLCRAWETSDVRMQSLATGAASLVLTAVLLWTDRLWSLPVAGLAVGRMGMTVVVLWLWMRTHYR
jgi:hypothetical protein